MICRTIRTLSNIRALRYLAVGAAVTISYTATALALRALRLDPLTASAAAFLAVQPFAFAAHSAITYADAPHRHVGRFLILACTGFLLTIGVTLGVTAAGWPYWSSLCVGWFLIPVANYVFGAVWVFRVKSLRGIRS